MSVLLKHISEYFNTFPEEDYTIYVDGIPTKLCKVNIDKNVVWKILKDDGKNDWYFIYISDIEAIRLTPTTMEIIKTNGKAYRFVAKLKTKEEKAKDIILRTKVALHALHYNDVLTCLIELEALMDEQ